MVISEEAKSKSEAATVKIVGNTKEDIKSMELLIKLLSGLVLDYMLEQKKMER